MSFIFSLFVLFAVVTLTELVILVKLWQATGFAVTLGIIIGTAALGSFLVRRQGLIVWRKFNEDLARGELPADRMIDGLFIIISGALLLTLGLITDSVGFLLLVPGNRRILKGWLKAHIKRKMEAGRIHIEHVHTGPTIDVEASRVDDGDGEGT